MDRFRRLGPEPVGLLQGISVRPGCPHPRSPAPDDASRLMRHAPHFRGSRSCPWVLLLPPLLLGPGLEAQQEGQRDAGVPGSLTEVDVSNDACPGGEVSRIIVENRSIYDLDEVSEDAGLGWFYRAVNATHIRTREEFIRDQLLLREGDCFDPEDLWESARVLREFRFLSDARLAAVEQPGGDVHVTVLTRDEWTTKLALDLRFEDGFRFEGISVVEENILGRGAAVGFFRIARREDRRTGALTEVPGVGGSEWDVLASFQQGPAGRSGSQAFVRPFVGESRGTAVRQGFSRSRTLFGYALPEGESFSHLVAPLTTERGELSLARRWGEPGDLKVLAGGLSYERVAPGSFDAVEGIMDADFGERHPVDGEVAEALAPHLGSRQAVRVNLMAGLRRMTFQTVRGLDAVTGVQDLPIGEEVIVSVGRSVGTTGRDRPGDTFVRFDLRRGTYVGPAVSFLALAAEGRRVDGGTTFPGTWGDVLAETHALLYFRPAAAPSTIAETMVVRTTVQGGWATSAPFQLTLGGPDGVRGFRDFELPVGGMGVLTVESRGRRSEPLFGALDLGVTLFADLGTGWSGDVPFARDAAWRGALGGGLRMGFPPGSSRVIRADLAFPVGPSPRGRGPVLRISAREWIGLLDDYRSPDMERSRRSGIRGEYVGAARDRRVP